jgi:hypothetical protein
MFNLPTSDNDAFLSDCVWSSIPFFRLVSRATLHATAQALDQRKNIAREAAVAMFALFMRKEAPLIW